uniref:peroxidase n=4 Tax=Nymphaea colorata TaxID=210225 RepID=A0A5K1GVR9_9MAGN
MGGPTYEVPLGRRDARTSNKDDASQLPSPFKDLDDLAKKFQNKGFSMREMVALSGAHTVGFARCSIFRERIYNETDIDPDFAATLQNVCPRTDDDGDGGDVLAPLDHLSPMRFGNNYFQALLNRRGLLHSDQVLFNGGSADEIVRTYANDGKAFSVDFANAMVKLGNLIPPTDDGEVRVSCRRVN